MGCATKNSTNQGFKTASKDRFKAQHAKGRDPLALQLVEPETQGKPQTRPSGGELGKSFRNRLTLIAEVALEGAEAWEGSFGRNNLGSLGMLLV